MRIAVISDIHSNLMALNMAIADATSKNVDKFIFLGDYITDGENGNKVLDIIKTLSLDVILGNREKYILNYNPDKRDYQNYRTISNTYDSLSSENLKYIKELEAVKVLDVNGFKILMFHGDDIINLDDGITFVFDKIIDTYDFDICLFGHSHKYFNMKYRDKRFINPGSIGIPTDTPSYKYCIIGINEDINVELREFKVSDTFDVFKREYVNSFYYRDSPVWCGLILNAIRDGQDYCESFMEIFNSKIKRLGERDINSFNCILAATYQDFCDNLNEINHDFLDSFFKGKRLFDIRTFFEFCKNNINFGFVDQEGKKYYETINDKYFLQAPLDVLDNRLATSYDAVELYRKFFNRFTIKMETYFLCCQVSSEYWFGQAILVYYDLGKVYWFEPLLKEYCGIHGYKNLEDLLMDFKGKFIESNFEKLKDLSDYKYYLYKYIEPKYYINAQEFYLHCKNCIEI